MTTRNFNTHLDDYNEAEALQQLLSAVNQTTHEMLERYEAAEKRGDYGSIAAIECDFEFSITVGGVQTAFMLGGPQQEALYKFIQHIASENFYSVDIDNGLVTE